MPNTIWRLTGWGLASSMALPVVAPECVTAEGRGAHALHSRCP